MITKITFSVLTTNYSTRLKVTTKHLIRYGMIRLNMGFLSNGAILNI